jgi:hypothetical protein
MHISSNYKNYYFYSKNRYYLKNKLYYKNKQSLGVWLNSRSTTTYKLIHYFVGIRKGVVICFVCSSLPVKPDRVTFRALKSSVGVFGGMKNVRKIAKSGPVRFIAGTTVIMIQMVVGEDVRHFALNVTKKGRGPAVYHLSNTWQRSQQIKKAATYAEKLTRSQRVTKACLKTAKPSERPEMVLKITLEEGQKFTNSLREKCGTKLVPYSDLRGDGNLDWLYFFSRYHRNCFTNFCFFVI